MLELRRDPHGVVFYVSALLAAARVPHAFSTRLGGISPPPFDSMNLGIPNGCEIQDDYDRIWENYRLLHRAAGCALDKPCRVHQVHGAQIARVRVEESFDTSIRADALVSDDPARVLSVRVADCVPILIASRSGDRVAAVHAGWRGIVGGVIPAALGELAGEVPFDRFVAAIGPCIGFDAFEVGPEVVEEFTRVFGTQPPCRSGPLEKGHVDLRQAARRQLLAAGIPSQQIDSTDRCTFRDREEFFSHRRDNGITGRMAAVIQCTGTKS